MVSFPPLHNVAILANSPLRGSPGGTISSMMVHGTGSLPVFSTTIETWQCCPIRALAMSIVRVAPKPRIQWAVSTREPTSTRMTAYIT